MIQNAGGYSLRAAETVPNFGWELPATPLEWQDEAVCAETAPEIFFPEKGGSTKDAKNLCAACDVREQCLAYAIDNDERFGIWGGLSERERRPLQKARRAAA